MAFPVTHGAVNTDSMLEDILAGIDAGAAPVAQATPARGGLGGLAYATPATRFSTPAVNPFARGGPAYGAPTPFAGGMPTGFARAPGIMAHQSASGFPQVMAPATGPLAVFEDDDVPPAPIDDDETLAAPAACHAASAALKAAGDSPVAVVSSAAWAAQLNAVASDAPQAGHPQPEVAGIAVAAYGAEMSVDEIPERDAEPASVPADGSLPLEDDGTLPFFFLDAYEDAASVPGTVFLFGKVPLGPKEFVSACAAVEGLQRCIFAVPEPSCGLFDDHSGELAELQAAADAKDADQAAKNALSRALNARCAPLKAELREALLSRGVSKFTMKPVRRAYAFERADVPRGRQYVLKVKYSATEAAMPSDMRGTHYCALFGTQTSCAELLLLKRKIMGPSWLALSGCAAVPAHAQRSWCRLEVQVSGAKGVTTPALADSASPRDAPPLVVASLSLKTVLNHRANVNEVAAASVVLCRAASIEGPMPKAAWNTTTQLRHFSIVRRLDGVSFPPGWDATVEKENGANPVAARTGAPVLHSAASERALLGLLLARLCSLDPDVVVGHNIAGFDLDVLLHRLQACKVPHWSRLGRLKRSRFPHLGGGGGSFGGGAGAGALSALAGRLLADTYLAAREYSREVSYTLTSLAKSALGQARGEVSSADIPNRYSSPAALLELAKAGETDAWLSLSLLFHFNVLPLTRQLTCLSGSLWCKTLSGARAQRIEYLLLHEFQGRKYLLPDKLPFKEKARVARAAAAEEGGDDGECDEAEDGAPGGGGAKGGAARKRGAPAYAGGLVLEPKKGLYDKYVLLLDFNSLYPSIIQEYNICFTTVERPEEGAMAALPPPAAGGPGGEGSAVLPQVLRRLVQRRRAVKDLMKSEKDEGKRRQLDIRQLAIKLTANSMYGCLGFTGSRFYAKPLAELVTLQGREILQSTVDLVQGTLMKDVIYGDTDSIMVNTGCEDLAEVRKLGADIKREVNKRYKLLEIEMDGVFKSMLLLKKKKYAALKIKENPDGSFAKTADGSIATVVEAKGLDIVRRDWCGLSKELGNMALGEILSGRPADDVVAAIHAKLRDTALRLSAGGVPLEAFIITKALTKRPEDYPDAKSQPHVAVALRRVAAGKRDGVAAGETVPYVVCVSVAEGLGGIGAAASAAAAAVSSASGGKGLAERAFHPEEVTPGGTLAIDVSYYLNQQLHPVVSRLCAPIAGTDAGQLAEALGLDASRFKGSPGTAGGGASRDDALLGASTLDDDERFAGCPPLMLRRADGSTFPFAGCAALASGDVSVAELLGALTTPPKDGAATGVSAASVQPLSTAQLCNQVKLAAHTLITRYYDGWMRSDDELYPCDTRMLSLRVTGLPLGMASADAKCGGKMTRVYGEAQLYTQLANLRRLMDWDRALRKVSPEAQAAAKARGAGAEKTLSAAREVAENVCALSAFRYVDLSSMCAV